MDLTIEAIEQDLMNAEANAGRPVMAVHLKRAEIRAMLMAMPQQFEAVFVDSTPEPEPEPELESPTDTRSPDLDALALIVEEDSDVDADFFAEAKRERKK